MKLFMNLFFCGKDKERQQNSPCFPRFCFPNSKKILTSTDQVNKQTQKLTERTLSTFSHPMTLVELSLPFSKPKTRCILLSQSLNDTEFKVDWGFLVGVINPNRQPDSFISSDALKLNIGHLEQFSCVSAIRKYGLDTLVIFWNEMGGQISVKDIITINQPLVIVLEKNQSLKKLLLKYDQQLKLELGEISLKQGLGKIEINIFKKSGKYMIEIRKNNGKFQEHFRLILAKQMGLDLDQQRYNRLLEVMTLNDYVDLQESKKSAFQRITNYLKQIEKQAELQKINEILACYSPSVSHKTSQDSIKEKMLSDYEHYVQYFTSTKAGQKGKQQYRQYNQQNLEIYFFNNTSENQQSSGNEDISNSSRQIIIKKSRSRSLGGTYVPDQFLDDEFFQKYA